MPWRKKVKQMIAGKDENGKFSYTAGKNDEDQKYYEGKVKGLLKCCTNFERVLLAMESEFTADKIEGLFKTYFKDFMRKMFSRTSKVLKKMDKNLKNLKKKSLAEDGAAALFKKAFEYKSEANEKNGYVKRSAIDDEAVLIFFNGKELKNRGLHHAIDVLVNRAKRQEAEVDEWANNLISDTQLEIEELKRKLEVIVEGGTGVGNSADMLQSFLQEIANSMNSSSGSSGTHVAPPPPPPPGFGPPPPPPQSGSGSTGPSKKPSGSPNMGDLFAQIRAGTQLRKAGKNGEQTSTSTSTDSQQDNGIKKDFAAQAAGIINSRKNPQNLKNRINGFLTEIKGLESGDENVKKAQRISRNLTELVKAFKQAKDEWEKTEGIVKKRAKLEKVNALQTKIDGIKKQTDNLKGEIKKAYNELKEQGEDIDDMSDELKEILEIK